MAELRFVHPEFLYALALVAIPIIVHLFNFRRYKKITFTNVKFLREITEETSSRSKLKHLLTLLARILAVVFLVLTFAQPYIPAKGIKQNAGTNAVNFYIDNSFSMDAGTREGTLLDKSRDLVKEIASSYKPSDKFQLLTNDFEPAHQRYYSRDEFLSVVEKVKISPVVKDLGEIMTRQSDALAESGLENRYSYIISDFQKPFIQNKSINNDSLVNSTFVRLQADDVANISIDSIWFTSPVLQKSQPAELNVLLVSSGISDEQQVSVNLSIDNVQRAVASAELNESGRVEVKLTFTPEHTGWFKGLVTIDDTPIQFDDEYFFSFRINESIRVLNIYEKQSSNYFDALFSNEDYFTYKSNESGNADYSGFDDQDLIIVDGLTNISSGLASELGKFIEAGGTLVLFPDSSAATGSYDILLSRLGTELFESWVSSENRIEELNLKDPVFEGVFTGASRIDAGTDLPVSNGYLKITKAASIQREELMLFRSDDPFMLKYSARKGPVYLFTVPLNDHNSNFGRHALFVPVMFRVALLSKKQNQLSYKIGDQEMVNTGLSNIQGDESLHLIHKGYEFDIIPGLRTLLNQVWMYTGDQPQRSGLYELMSGDSLISVIAYNYDRSESRMEFFSEEQLNKFLKDSKLGNSRVFEGGNQALQGIMNVDIRGIALWKYCLILVLLFLMVETLLLKYFRS